MRSVLLAAGLMLCAASALVHGDSVRDATPQEIEAIKVSMERLLLDAPSARLSDVKVKGEHMCGLVNAKNRMGAYVGYRPFTGMVFRDTTGKLLAATLGIDGHETVTRMMCAEQGIPLPP